MSRIGKKPITIPEGVEVKIEGRKVIVRSEKGELQKNFQPEIEIKTKEGKILVGLFVKTKKAKAFWGLTRALLQNMVKGVKEGYEKKIEMEGIGFKALLEGNDLVLYVGFSHPVKFKAPQGIKFLVEKNTITISGIDKELVSQTAANIRKIKPPEPYKGKGIRYVGEVIRRKAGKKAATAK